MSLWMKFLIPIVFGIVAAQLVFGTTPRVRPDVRRSVVRNFTNCGSEGEILQVTIPDCPHPPCNFTVGQNYMLAAYFRSKNFHKNLEAEFVVLGARRNKTIISLNTAVDVEEGMIGAFAYPLDVSRDLGTGPVTLRVKISDEGVNEMCFTVPAIISS